MGATPKPQTEIVRTRTMPGTTGMDLAPTRPPLPRTPSTTQRIAQGSLLLGGGLLVGVGVLIGSVITWRLRATSTPPPAAVAAPIEAKRMQPNYELLIGPAQAAQAAQAADEARAAEVAREETATAEAPPEEADAPRERERVRRSDRASRNVARKATASAAFVTRSETRPEAVQKPAIDAAAKALADSPGAGEAKRLIAACDALKRAPDAELRMRVRAMAETPCVDPAVVAVRDRCAKVYTNLLDGLARIERIAEQIANGDAEGPGRAKLEQELEAADDAANTAKRGIGACENGLDLLRAQYNL